MTCFVLTCQLMSSYEVLVIYTVNVTSSSRRLSKHFASLLLLLDLTLRFSGHKITLESMLQRRKSPLAGSQSETCTESHLGSQLIFNVAVKRRQLAVHIERDCSLSQYELMLHQQTDIFNILKASQISCVAPLIK